MIVPLDGSKRRFASALLPVAIASLVLAAFAFSVAPAAAEEEEWTPLGLVVTLVEDPLRNAVIDWHFTTRHHEPEFSYRVRGGDGAWKSVDPVTERFPFSTTRSFSRVHLTGLEPGGEYEFRFGEGSKVYRLRMLPETLERPLVVAVGGDTMHNARDLAEVNRRAMAYEPDLVVWGGDLAYADGREDRRRRWYDWLSTNLDTLVDDTGRAVPLIVGIGNHEVRGGYHQGGGRGQDAYRDDDEFRLEIAPYFYRLFAFPGHPGYGVLDFADYLSLVILDTDHSGPIEGTQTDWLARTLEQRAGKPAWVIPVYHVPGYPSVRGYGDRVSRGVREHWVPLFESHGVRLAFENHDHAYKRTPPLRGHEPASAEEGIVYLGDGAWGVGTRATHDPETTPYLEKAIRVRHAIIMKLHPDKAEIEVVAQDGETIDRTTIER